MGETFAGIVSTGPLSLGIAVAALAGLVSFLSPCILPLVPGYLAYVTGLTGADLTRPAGAEPAGSDSRQPGDGGTSTGGDADRTAAGVSADRMATVAGGGGTPAGAGGVAVRTRPAGQGRVVLGTLLFVAGFGAVFVTAGVVAASAGRLLREHQRLLEIGAGGLMIVFALALLGFLPVMQREVRSRWLPSAGLAGAPIFGAVFGLSWVPCIGPTIGAVLALGAVGGEPGRAAVLATAYTLGLGLPFLAFGAGLRWATGAVAVVRRHAVWVSRAGAALLLLVALALLTGGWSEFVFWLRGTIGAFEVIL